MNECPGKMLANFCPCDSAYRALRRGELTECPWSPLLRAILTASDEQIEAATRVLKRICGNCEHFPGNGNICWFANVPVVQADKPACEKFRFMSAEKGGAE
jgi:hypothetical protein